MKREDLTALNVPEETVDAILQMNEADLKLASDAAEERLSAAAFDHQLDNAITAAKGRNTKAIRALLDVDGLRASENQEDAIKSALEALQTESGYLFQQDPVPPPYAAGTGTTPILLVDEHEAAFREAIGVNGGAGQ